MKKAKKLFIRLVVGILSVATLLCSAACGGSGDKIDRSETTISVRAHKGGYGTSYLNKLKEKFETLYADKGYKVQILTPSADMQGTVVAQEMYSKDDWADVYFSSELRVKHGVAGDYGQVFADMTDLVWNKPAIDFNGKEEGKTIKDKLNVDVSESVFTYNDRVYCMPLAASLGGIIVNTDKLAKYGYTELPRTSKELFGMFEKIYKTTLDSTSPMRQIYPLTFLGTQNGYHLHVQTVWLAQYMGIDGYNRFMGFFDENGEWRIEDGYKAYEDPALDALVTNLYEMYDPMYTAPGTLRNDSSAAHAMIMAENSGAVFMAEGDWSYNEIATDYTGKLDNLAFISAPVISELGVKLFGAGTSYNYSEEKCEEILSWTISQLDAGKTIAQIKSASEEMEYNVKETEIERIQEARGVYCDRSLSSVGLAICEKSTKKDIAALFVRMFCSDDGAVLYNAETNGYTSYVQDFTKMKGNQFSKSYINIRKNPKAHGVYLVTTELRKQLTAGIGLLPKEYFLAEKIIYQAVTAYDPKTGELLPNAKEIYRTSAADYLKAERNYASSNWENWVKNISAN